MGECMAELRKIVLSVVVPGHDALGKPLVGAPKKTISSFATALQVCGVVCAPLLQPALVVVMYA